MQTSEKYNKKEEQGDYNLSVGVRPSDYMALQELRNVQDLSQLKKSYPDQKEKFSTGLYIDFKIGMKNGKKLIPTMVNNQQEYSFLIGELNYLIQNDLYVLNEQHDTLKALFCNFSHTYETGKDISLTFCFPMNKIKEDKSDKLQLQYKDNVFGLEEKVDFIFGKDETIDSKHTIKDIED